MKLQHFPSSFSNRKTTSSTITGSRSLSFLHTRSHRDHSPLCWLNHSAIRRRRMTYNFDQLSLYPTTRMAESLLFPPRQPASALHWGTTVSSSRWITFTSDYFSECTQRLLRMVAFVERRESARRAWRCMETKYQRSNITQEVKRLNYFTFFNFSHTLTLPNFSSLFRWLSV